jgi:hypothetical protein
VNGDSKGSVMTESIESIEWSDEVIEGFCDDIEVRKRYENVERCSKCFRT